jgi:glycine cleavage system aminomethyltransferase T
LSRCVNSNQLTPHAGASQAGGGDCSWEIHDDRSLLALQGPNAAPTVQKLTSVDLSKMFFSNFASFDIAGIPCWVTRTGYTGEDGFEISVRGFLTRLPLRRLLGQRACQHGVPG